jgi:hypothetical protein
VCHHRPGRRCDPTPARSRSRARPCGHVALRRCAPQHARALARKARLGLWPLFLRRTSMVCSCRPRHHGPAVGVCFAHAVARRERHPFWSASAHLATGRRFHTHVFVPDCGCLVRRHLWPGLSSVLDGKVIGGHEQTEEGVNERHWR